MPNWVYNNLTAIGPEEDIARYKEQVSQPFTVIHHNWKTDEMEEVTVEAPFAYWNILRPSDDELADYFTVADGKAPAGNWYEWNNKNWGVKWEASDVEVRADEPDHYTVAFSSPWGPPDPVLVELSRQYPTVTFTLEFEEETGWGGETRFENGTQIEVDFYNEPESHKDYEDRDRECWCEIQGEPVFDDCPVTENKERAELEAQVMEDLLDLNTQVV